MFGMYLRTHRFRLITFAFVALLMVVVATALITQRDRRENRHRVLMKASELAAGIAKRLRRHSLENSAWNWRDGFFKSDLDYRVRRGQLSRVSVLMRLSAASALK
jgi:hypothetical protein